MAATATANPDGGLDRLGQRSVRGAFATLLGQFTKLVVTFGSQVVLAQLLAPADFGLVAMVTPALVLLQIFAELGLLQAIVQAPSLSRRQLDALFWASLAVSAGTALVMAGLAPLLAALYGEPRVLGIALCMAGLVLLSGTAMTPTALLNRQMRFSALAIIDAGSVTLSAAAGIIGALLGLGYWSLVVSQAVFSLTGCLAAWALARWRPGLPARGAGVGVMLRFGGNVTAANLAGNLGQAAVNVLLGATLGKVPLGLYDRATKLASQPLGQLIAPVARVAVPTLSRLADQPERYRAAYRRMLQVLILALTPGFLFAALCALPVITGLFGQAWSGAAPAFAWLCLGAVITPANASLFWLLISQGRGREHMWLSCGAGAVTLLACLAGLPWGLEGIAAVPVLSVWLVQSPVLVWAVTRRGPVRARDFLRAVLPIGLGALAAALALGLLPIAQADLLGLGLRLALAYLAMGLTLGLMPAGRAVLAEAWHIRTLLLGGRTG